MASEQQPAASWGADTDGRLNQPSEHLTDYAMWAKDASGNVTGLVGPGGESPLRFTQRKSHPGHLAFDWSSPKGTLALASAGADEAIALDPSTLYKGKPTLKCTFSTATSTFVGRYTPTNGVNLKNLVSIQVPIKITCNESASNVAQNAIPFQIWLKSGALQIRLQIVGIKVLPDGWHVFSFSSGSNIVYSGGASWDTFDTHAITQVDFVQATVAASNAYPVWVGPITINAKAALGRVTIRMDGEYISQYTLIKPLLDKYNLKTSLALTTSSIGSSGSFMTEAQINEFYADNHEVIHHTYNAAKTGGYASAADWASGAAITDDIRSGFEYFESKGWVRGLGFIAEAYSGVFEPSVTQARQRLVLSGMQAAGVKAQSSSSPVTQDICNLAADMTERPFFIPGGIQISNTHTAEDVIAKIDLAEQLGEWAVITIHRAVASSPGSLEMTAADMDTWMAHLRARIDAGGVYCDPFGTVYTEFWR